MEKHQNRESLLYKRRSSVRAMKAILHESECGGFVLITLPYTCMRPATMNALGIKEYWNVSTV